MQSFALILFSPLNIGVLKAGFVRLFGHFKILILASQEADLTLLKVGFHALSSQKHGVWLHRAMFLTRKVIVMTVQTQCFCRSIAWLLLPTGKVCYM